MKQQSSIRFVLCLTSSSSEIKISCSKSHRFVKHLTVYVPQPVAPATWRQTVRTCVFQWRKPHDHLKETTTLLSVKEPPSLFDISHYRIIILRAEIPCCLTGVTSGRNVWTSFPYKHPNKNTPSLTWDLKRTRTEPAMYTTTREVIWLLIHTQA